MNTFKFNDYRALVNAHRADHPHGTQSRLAKAAGCSPSWLTRVLNGTVHFTPDQANAIAAYLHLTDPETEYFLLLVDYERASTPALQKRLRARLDALKREGQKLALSARTDGSVADEFAVKYYSTWIYAAVHVACMIKPLRASEIAGSLSCPLRSITKTLRDLSEMGLVKGSGETWTASTKNIHLPATHPGAKLTHLLWRNRTAQFLQDGNDEGLHYSAIHCLSVEDIERIHNLLNECILKARTVIAKSPAESLAVFCLDWYALPVD